MTAVGKSKYYFNLLFAFTVCCGAGETVGYQNGFLGIECDYVRLKDQGRMTSGYFIISVGQSKNEKSVLSGEEFTCEFHLNLKAEGAPADNLSSRALMIKGETVISGPAQGQRTFGCKVQIPDFNSSFSATVDEPSKLGKAERSGVLKFTDADLQTLPGKANEEFKCRFVNKNGYDITQH